MNNEEQITVFAKTNYRNREVPFGIKTDDRRRHMYLIGKTGMGKTTLMENMVIQDIRNGHGVAFLDPHGDSVQKILNCVPSGRVNDVIYFNPADLEFPVAFNILEAVDTKYKHLVASGLMGVFTKIWANLWSARMEYILNNTILALLDSPGNTLLGITRMYVDKKYRKKIVDNIKDPMVRAFWVDEFANYNEKYRTEAIAPIQNKVGQFLSSGIIRNIVGQPKSTIDLREVMDKNKILIMDLSKGRVGEDNSALLGAMLVTKLQLAAMSRTDIIEEQRKDFYLYVDEFQNFATESFATILSEARKYRLNLVVGHQYIAQLEQDKSTKVRDAVFGNVGTIVCFRIGAADAEFLETEFEPIFSPTDLVNLPKYNIILRLMINGVASDPFSAVTLPPNPEFVSDNIQKVIKVSRERYSNPAAEVEDKISRWMGAEFHQESAMVIGDGDKELSPENAAVLQLSAREPVVEFETSDLSATLALPPQPAAEETTTEKRDVRPTSDEPAPALWEMPKASPQAARPQEQPEQSNTPKDRDRQRQHRPERLAEGTFNHGGGRHEDRERRDNRPTPYPRRELRFEHQRQLKRDFKSQNPIWNTVANLHTQKVKEEEKKISQAVKNIVQSRPRPPQAPPAQKSPEMKIQNQPATPAPPPIQPQPEEQASERTVLQPGQAHKF